MMRRLSTICLIVLILLFSGSIFAQDKMPLKSPLAMIELPADTIKLDESNAPEQVETASSVLTNLFTKINSNPSPIAPKARFRAGVTEFFLYCGYGANKLKSEQLIKKFETAFQAAGWKYERSKEKIGPVTFQLERSSPEPVKLVGAFTPKDTALFFVLAEFIPDVTGKWNIIAEVNGNFIKVTLELVQERNVVTGTFSSNIGGGTIREIKLRGNNLEALAKIEVQKRLVDIKLEGQIDGDKMKGTLFVKGLPDIPFTGEKV